MLVRDLMTANPACCTPDTSIRDVVRLMALYDCGAIPIVRSQLSKVVVGIVTDRDIVCRALANGRDALTLTARECMSSPVISVRDDDTLEDCCRTLAREKIRRAPVEDESGACCGIVSLADVAARAPGGVAMALLRQLSFSATQLVEVGAE